MTSKSDTPTDTRLSSDGLSSDGTREGAAPEGTIPTPEELDARRKGFTPELWSVLDRYGRDKVIFTLAIMATNEAIDVVGRKGRDEPDLRRAFQVLVVNMGSLVEWITKSEGWTWDSVVECLMDVNRARQLATPGPSTRKH